MFGWINDCTEKLVISKFGVEKWHEIKDRACCLVKDGGFVRHQRYPDSSTVSLVQAASEVLEIPVEGILEAFGAYFMEFTRQEGYENLLGCQGSTLRTWLSNINALHDHLESSLPRGMVKPVFWCEDDEEVIGSIQLHYFSQRGNLLAPIVLGTVKEIARYHFKVAVNMESLQLQDVNGAPFTTWRITAADPKEAWKVTQREKVGVLSDNTADTTDQNVERRCPFSGKLPTASSGAPQEGDVHLEKRNCSFSEDPVDDSSQSTTEGRGCVQTSDTAGESKSEPETHDITISSTKMKEIFPYHVVVNKDFTILQVGKDLPSLLSVMEADMIGISFKKMVRIVKPVHGVWDWQALRKLEDQTFFMKPLDHVYENIKLKGNMVRISSDPFQVMFVLSPDAKNVNELRQMHLTMSDLPLHSFQRDAVFLGEHIASEVKSAHKLDKLSKKLEHEKNLSNSLLYSLLPKHVADELRAGNTVEPEFHENVTVFFSDIVGFTTLCDGIHSWEVIDLLNRLYCVMDYLCDKFCLYKIDTIGDAFICCSGLPEENENHAENVANFAVAVRHCATQVVSPIDGEPIVMRMGIHTGQCMSGVVGMTTPRYCVFSDTMNTASRHESTCEPGRIQCSSITYGQLAHFSRHENQQFQFTPRGLIDMKGKGKMYTYWIEGGTDHNVLTNKKALDDLYVEVEEMLSTKTFVNKKYFDRWARSRNSISTTTTDCTTDDDPELAAMLAAELAQMEGDLDDFD